MILTALLVLALVTVTSGILPEIIDSGINHILEERPEFVQVQHLPEEKQKPGETLPEANERVINYVNNLPEINPNETHFSSDPETNNISPTLQPGDLENNIDHGCKADDDCGKGKYCHSRTNIPRCQSCKETDSSCTKDAECCGNQMCVWGQCSQNATKGEAGSTCQFQNDCSSDLCCAFHQTLFFAVCSAKPIERERCFDASNHLMELLSWDTQGEGPMKHCPCAGDLRCQHLGRGSMCLKGEDSNEEDLSESLYSEIDYIL